MLVSFNSPHEAKVINEDKFCIDYTAHLLIIREFLMYMNMCKC